VERILSRRRDECKRIFQILRLQVTEIQRQVAQRGGFGSWEEQGNAEAQVLLFAARRS
jgi:hypothetical protein